MSEFLSRQEVAEIFGVNVQTVSNWSDYGLINSFIVNKRRVIPRNAVESLKEKLFDIADAENKVSEYRKTIFKEKEKLNELENSLRLKYSFLSGTKDEICTFFEKAYQILSKDVADKRTIDCVCMFLRGKQLKEIGELYGITSTRASQIVKRGFRMLSRVDKYSKIVEEKNRLIEILEQKEMSFKLLKESYEKLQEEYLGNVSENTKVELPEIMYAKVKYLGFSKRLQNVFLYGDINTVYDIVRLTKEKLLKFRNLGQKSIKELEEFLNEYGLKIGMTSEDIINMKINK